MSQRITTLEALNYIGRSIKLCGWAQNIRTHGKVVFIDLRDRKGILQVVFAGKELSKTAKEIKPEWVLEIEGVVQKRPEGTINPDLPTGEIELLVSQFTVLSKAKR